MLPGLGALPAFAVATREGAALEARFNGRRDNQAAMERFRTAAAGINDVEALLKDRRTLQIVLEAFQLESEIDKRGIIRKVLTEPPAESTSLANRLVDRRWRDLAQAFATRQASALTPTQVDALSTTAVQALSLAQVSGLTAAQVGALSSRQVAALSTAQLGAIDLAAIGRLDTDDIAALSSSQVAALTPAQVRELTVVQLRAIETSDLVAMGTSQIAALTSTQLSLLRPTQVAALTGGQAAALTRGQAAAIDTSQLSAGARTLLSSAAPPPGRDPPTPPARRPFADPALLDRIVRDASTNRYEKAMGEANGGLRKALYFLRNASKVTRVEELMADRALTAVVRGAAGLPDSFGTLDFDQQRDLLNRRFDVKDLQDPREVQKLARRYLALAAPQVAQPGSEVLALFGGGTSLGAVGGTLSFRA